MNDEHETRMRIALAAAAEAAARDEVPVGACLFDAAGNLLATAGNRTIGDNDPTAHAEILVLRAAAQEISNYRLGGTTLYTTVEPCVMCAGAIINARVARLVFGTPDERFGAVETHFGLCSSTQLNHQTEIVGHVLADEARALMQSFFAEKRARQKTLRGDASLT